MEAGLIIKVCGMREAGNIREVEALRPDWMGFIFWEGSRRCVSPFPSRMPTQAKRVGVFVDEDIQKVIQTARDCALDFIQLHGHESPDYVAQLRRWEVIKAFNIAHAEDFKQTRPYEGVADYFLFDTKGKAVGGNGEKFDWSVLNHYQGSTPFLLSGGIGPEDAAQVKNFHHPKCIGIDLNSRFETAPGLKDVAKLRTFIKQIRL